MKKAISLDENSSYFGEKDASGLLNAASSLTLAMDYFVANGSYKQEDYAKLYDAANYTTIFIDYAKSILK